MKQRKYNFEKHPTPRYATSD